MNKSLLIKTLRNTTGAVCYIFLVSQLMQNGSKLFGEKDTMFTPFIILMLFSLSAAVVGGLVFGETLLLFFDGKKKESIMAATYSIGWLAAYTALVITILVLVK